MRYRANRAFRTIATRPLEAIEFILSMTYFLGGLWILSPFYDSVYSTSAIIVGGDLNRYIAIWQLFITIPLIYSYFKDSTFRLGVRSKATYFLFLTGLFYAVGLFATYGFTSVSWLSTLGIALVFGVCHLRIKWEIT